MDDSRPLTQAESALLTFVIDHIDVDGIDDLRAQVAHIEVTTGTIPSFLNLEVNHSAPRSSITTSPLPIRIFVGAPGAEAGEILVWVESGYLCGLEYAWYTDEMPDKWPEVESLHLG